MPFYDPIRIGASGAETGYTVSRSLRFNSAHSESLINSTGRTVSTGAYTLSFWVKIGTLSTSVVAIAGGLNSSGANNSFGTMFYYNNKFYWYHYSNADDDAAQTDGVIRDQNAWYHVLISKPVGSNGTLYLNGVAQTKQTASSSEIDMFSGNLLIGAQYTTSTGYRRYFDGYVAELHAIDGTALTPSSFTETNVLTGQLNPKNYTGSHGSRGFYLNFSDNSAATATTLGKDSSGNGINFTPTNMGTGDAVKDSPTNNFAVAQMMGFPFESGASFALGNLQLTSGSTSSARNLNRSAFAPMLVNSGKWYAEFMHKDSSNSGFIGVGPYQQLSPTANNTRYAYVRRSDGAAVYRTAGSEVIATYGSSIAQYNVIGVYLDMDAGTPVVYFSKNGQWADGSGNFDESSPTSGITLGDTFFTTDTGNSGFAAFIFSSSDGGTSVTIHANFGQDSTFDGQISAGGNVDANGIGDFKYTVPTGAKALCSANLPDPTILLPNKHFDTLLYTGNGGTQSITGLNFQPDLVWSKPKTTASHALFDSVRGRAKSLYSNLTNAEASSDSDKDLTSFDNNGFTLGAVQQTNVNVNLASTVAWNWNAGDSDGVTYKVVVVSDSGNKYRFRNSADSATFAVSAVQLNLAEGGTYVFDWSDSTAQGHPIRFSTTSDGTHGGGSEYTTGVVKDDSAYKTTITVAASAPQLYYYCQNHSGMGGQVNTNSTLGSSNFDGDVTPADEVPVVKANTSAGFSIISYTGQSGTYKVGHGLGIAPELIITKNRGSVNSWWTHITVVDGTLDWGGLNLNQGFQAADSYGISLPTSLTFGDDDDFTANNTTAICYCFNSVAGYSKVGTYRGNGNADGTFVALDFRPAFLLFKHTNATKDWFIYDSKSQTYNVMGKYLKPNRDTLEQTFATVDFLSNGFKIRTDDSAFNSDGSIYLFLAIAEAPFKNARAR